MKQTSMQSLVDLLKVNDIYKECMPFIIDIIDDVYLPMEKEQIINAFNTGMNHSADYFIPSDDLNEATEYYNNTFKQ